MTMIKFKTTKKDAALITLIAKRAVNTAASNGWPYPIKDAEMDITACHCNGNPLRLDDLLVADTFNFSHDVFGIHRNLNRETGALENLFSPRYNK
jgi:hypothetical protein